MASRDSRGVGQFRPSRDLQVASKVIPGPLETLSNKVTFAKQGDSGTIAKLGMLIELIILKADSKLHISVM